MFDIGFAELLVIGVVGLLVIGPDRLPETIRTAALWFGRLKRGLSSARQEFEQQIGADDIRRELRNESIMAELKKAEDEAGEIKESFDPEITKDTNRKTTSSDLPQQRPLLKTNKNPKPADHE
jgi:sec-independent protein translocase protein TatB